jgi:hypothetical protein
METRASIVSEPARRRSEMNYSPMSAYQPDSEHEEARNCCREKAQKAFPPFPLSQADALWHCVVRLLSMDHPALYDRSAEAIAEARCGKKQ